MFSTFSKLYKWCQLRKGSHIISIIKSLNPTKAHRFDTNSIRMTQLRVDSIPLPLAQIIKSALSQSVFPDGWKMANIIPVCKKEAKYLVKNYKPRIRFLLIFAKVFERFLCNSVFFHFHNNNLFIKCQSSFVRGDSSISQIFT